MTTGEPLMTGELLRRAEQGREEVRVEEESHVDLGGPRWLTAKLRNLVVQAKGAEPFGDLGAERGPGAAFASDGAPQDLPDFLRDAAPMAAGAALELPFHVVVEVANQELSHGLDNLTISLAFPPLGELPVARLQASLASTRSRSSRSRSASETGTVSPRS